MYVGQSHGIDVEDRLRARFWFLLLVPELTRSVDIQVNERVSLRPGMEAFSV
jgi:hypothetical protein